MRATCRNPQRGQQQWHKLWNQKAADSGSFLFARMAASYIRPHGGLLHSLAMLAPCIYLTCLTMGDINGRTATELL
jgi:hypothetical protein